MRKLIPILSMLLMFTYSLLGQTTTVSLPDTTAIKGTDVLVPVQLSAPIDSVGAVTFKIWYDSSAVDFVSIENNNLVGGTFLTNTIGDSLLLVSWNNLSDPVDLETSIFDIKFAYKQGTSELKFVGENEVGDSKGNKLPITFTNGEIAALPVQISLSKEVGAVGDTVVVELTAAQLEDIGAMNLYIDYSETSAKFVGMGDINLPNFVVGESTNRVSLGMATIDGFDHASGVLATLLFEVVAGTTPLSFDASSLVETTEFGPVNAIFTDGSVSLIDGTFALGDVMANAGEKVLVPLYAYDAVNVGSFNLDVMYDNTVLEFVNVNDELGIISNEADGVISLGYANASGLTANGMIAEIEFNYISGSSDVTFDKATASVTDNAFNVLNFDLVNGSVKADASPYFTDVMPDTSVAAEETLEYVYVGAQAEGKSVTYKLVSGPEGATLDTLSGAFAWTTSYDSPDTSYVIVSVMSDGLSATDTAMVVVAKANRAPEFTTVMGDESITVDNWDNVNTYSFQYEAEDPDGDAITFSLVDDMGGQAAITDAGLFTFTAKMDKDLYPSNDPQVVKFDALVSVSDGELSVTDTSSMTVDVTTDIEIIGGIPTEFALKQNYPNPFNPTSTIQFALPKQSNVNINVYNMLGQHVATLANSEMAAGVYNVQFNAVNLASGIYVYRINASAIDGSKDFTSVKKMMLMK